MMKKEIVLVLLLIASMFLISCNSSESSAQSNDGTDNSTRYQLNAQPIQYADLSSFQPQEYLTQIDPFIAGPTDATYLSYHFCNGSGLLGWTHRNAAFIGCLSSDDSKLESWLFDPNQSDPGVVSPSFSLAVSAKKISMHISTNCSNHTGRIYFRTSNDPSWTETKSKAFTQYGEYDWYDYCIDMGTNGYWNAGGSILQLRFDPADVGDPAGYLDAVGITYIEAKSICVWGVDLSEFKANWMNRQINVSWTTSDEADNAGWELYRSTSIFGPFEKINDSLIPAYQFDYLIEDTQVIPGNVYYYQLVDIDLSGKATVHEIIQAQ